MDKRWNRFFSCLAGTGAVLLPLLLASAAALAALQAVPAAEQTTWAFDTAIEPRTWYNSTVCGSWSMATNNTSPGDCVGWNTTWVWTCASGVPSATYLFSPASLVLSVLDRDWWRLANTTNLTGGWTLLDAGNKVLAGQDAFNQAYCLNGGNASVANITSMQGELQNVSLAVLKGKGNKLVPAPQGGTWAANMSLAARDSLGVRSGVVKGGNQSVIVTVNSATNWNSGTLNNITTSGSNLVLWSSGSVGNLTVDSSNSSTYTLFNSSSQLKAHVTRAESTIVYDRGRLPVGTAINNVGNLSWDEIVYSNSSGAAIGVVCYKSPAADGTSGCYDSRGTGIAYNVYMITTGGDPPTAFTFEVRKGSAICGSTVPGTFNTRYWLTTNISGANYHLNVYSDAGRTVSVGTSDCGLGGEIVDNIGLIGAFFDTAPSPNEFNTLIGNTSYNGTSLFGNTAYATSGTWNSSVYTGGDGTSNGYTWLNITATNASAPAGVNWNLSVRESNTSFNPNDSTPAWTSLLSTASGASGVAQSIALSNSRYFQAQLGLSTTDTKQTPSISSLAIDYTKTPYQTAPLAGNVSYAAPNEPVFVSVPYADPENGIVRVSFNNSSGGAVQCSNGTSATGNGSAYCSWNWNDTPDGNAPSLCGKLTDDDNAANDTNCSAPITTDSAPPVISLDSIANTSTGSFVLNLAGKDNASGTNRTWFDLTNLSNGTYVGTFENYTWTANGTITLCATCAGHLTVSAQSDDSLAAAWRHTAARSNVSFWFDPGPAASNFSATPLGADPAAGVEIWANVSDATANLTGANAVIYGPGFVTATYPLTLAAGTMAAGLWHYKGSIGNNFTLLGTYTVQVASYSQSFTSSFASSTNATFSYGAPAGGGASTAAIAAGGGGGGSSTITYYSSPTPAAASLSNLSGGLLCPPEVNQVYYRGARDTGNYSWSYTCRAAGVALDSCSIRGEFASGPSLTGRVDPWWSCSVAADAVTATYSLPVSAAPQQGSLPVVSWDTGARLAAMSGSNQTVIDFRLKIVNGGAGVSIGPADSILAMFGPLSWLSIATTGLFGVAAYIAHTRLRYLWAIAAVGVAFYGFASPEGGLLLGWVAYGVVGGLAWAATALDAKQKLAALQARYS